MGVFVIAAYKPKPGQDEALQTLLKDHLAILRGQNLATGRPPYLMQAKDGTYLEVFEWASEEAIAAAHQNPVVQALWDRFGNVCDFETLANIDEAKGMFPSFHPVDL